MRQTAAGLNRTWLTIVGLLAVLGGLAIVVVSTGQLAPLAGTIGLAVPGPGAGDQIAGGVGGTLGTVLAAVVLAAIGLVLLLLALLWLGAQVPRTNTAKPFRLHDDASRGLTTISPNVLTDAVEARITELPGVHKASAVLRGTAAAPDLTVRITADDRTDVPRLLTTVQTDVVDDLATALDTSVAALAIQIEIDSQRKKTDHAVL